MRFAPSGLPGRVWLVLAVLVALLAATNAGAREGDRAQPASIEADQAEINRALGQSRYFGDVVFEQGTLRITGDRLVIDSAGSTVRRVRVWGQPAHVRQQTDDGRQVRARALAIDYDLEKGMVRLTGQAELQRGGDHFAAGHIRYWPDSQRVEGSGGDEHERVHIRLQPQAGDKNKQATTPNE